MKKKNLMLTAACAAGSLLTVSAAIPAAASNSGTDSWSVFLYVCGSDLESGGGAASYNLVELMKAGYSEDVNVVVETGGSSSWKLDGIDSDKLERWELGSDGLGYVGEVASASMGEASTLGDFLSWGTKNYPADHYMVVLWNHGGGSAGGVCYDELYNDDCLNLSELSQGIASANVTFDLVGFDACLMATLENAQFLTENANYMVASEEYEPGGGWDYTAWGSYLFKNPDCSATDLGKVICDSYYDKCKTYQAESMATLSVVDLSAIPSVSQAFNASASEMSTLCTDVTTFRNFSQEVSRAQNYGGNTQQEGYTDMIDLGDWMNQCSDLLPQTSSLVTKALDDAVVYSIKGANRTYASGLSVFYPLYSSSNILDSYSEISKNPLYLSALSSMTYNWTAPSWVADASASYDFNDSSLDGYEIQQAPDEEDNAVANPDDYTLSGYTEVTDDGYFAMTMTDGIDTIDSVRFALYIQDDQTGNLYQLGLDDDLTADYDKGTFRDNFRGVWPTIDGCYCMPILIGYGDTYNLYSIPIELNGTQTNIRAIYDFDAEEYQILGIYDGVNDAGSSSRDVRQLEKGDEVTFLFYEFDENWNQSVCPMASFVVDEAPVMEESELFDGDYIYQYEITDIFGRVSYSDYATMECDNGEIYLYETVE